MKPEDRLSELRRASQESTFDFLVIELDLIETFHALAISTNDPQRRTGLVRKMKIALGTVRQFEGRIEDANARQQIHDRADFLEPLISKFGE